MLFSLYKFTSGPLQRICWCQAASQHAHCQTDSTERFADNLPKLPLIESMPFLGNFCPFPHKAPTVASGLLSHEAHYGGTQRTLMGPESLTPNWGRNCTDCALLSATRHVCCMFWDNVFLRAQNLLLLLLCQWGCVVFFICFVGVWVLSFPSVVPFCLPLLLPTALITPICSVYQTHPVLPISSQPAALASRVASLPSSLAFLVGVLQVQDRRCLLLAEAENMLVGDLLCWEAWGPSWMDETSQLFGNSYPCFPCS